MVQKYSDSADHIDVQYVANLARLELTGAEMEQFQSQLDQVLHYMDQLNELDVADVAPTAHAVSVTNVFREDEPRPSMDRDAFLANAPEHRGGQIVMPRIIE